MKHECDGQEPLDPRRNREDGMTFRKKGQEADDDTLEQIEKEKDRDAQEGSDE
jgi:hypothetical protein